MRVTLAAAALAVAFVTSSTPGWSEGLLNPCESGEKKCSVGESILEKLKQGPDAFDQNRAGAAVGALSSSLRHQGCHRWLYNNSGFTWKLIPPTLSDHAEADNGFVCNRLNECLAPPFTGVQMHWRSYDSRVGYQFRLMAFVADPNDVSKPKDANSVLFDQKLSIKDDSSTCAEIDYDGPAMIVNSPSNGDITTCGSSYDHAATWTHDVHGAHACQFKIPEPTIDQISEQYLKQLPVRCQDRSFEDGLTFQQDHCAKHAGTCRSGCDAPSAKPYSEIYKDQQPPAK